jgi:AcrR family transcriptional regulator
METTQQQLIRTAELLFASRGIDGPSLREIGRASGQRNTAALQYHFGSREELLQGVIRKTEPRVTKRRNELLRQPDPSLRHLVEALILPYVELLEDQAGGREYVQILQEIYSRPQRFAEFLRLDAIDPSLILWSELVHARIPERAQGAPLHRRFAAVRFVLSEVANRAREKHKNHDLFISNLMDMTQGLMSAPVSPKTMQHIE